MESTLPNAALVAANRPKTTTIVYWTVTALFCLQMSFTGPTAARLRSASNGAHSDSCAGSVSACHTIAGA